MPGHPYPAMKSATQFRIVAGCVIIIMLGVLVYFLVRPYLRAELSVRCQLIDTSKQAARECSCRPEIPSICRDPDMSDYQKQLGHVMRGHTGPKVKDDDPELLQIIRDNFIDLPRRHVTKLSWLVMETPQSQVVMKYLRNKTKGYFVECGALDGERSSNTLYLEREKGWTGLLIEPDTSYYMQIRGKNRKAYTSNACLSPHTYPEKMSFREHQMGQGRVITDPSVLMDHIEYVYTVYCLPLYSLMLALNQRHIDYLSLDVEGLELSILQTIPFDKLDISVITVEYKHSSARQQYLDYMESKGYVMVQQLRYGSHELYMFGNDYVFVKKSILAEHG